MDLKQTIKEAWQAVDAAGLPEHVQPAALQSAIAALAGPGVPAAPVAKPKPPIVNRDDETALGGAETEPTGGPIDEDEFFKKFAAESELEEDALRAVYYIKNGTVRIAGTKKSLGGSEAERNRTVALLSVGAKWYVDGKAAISITDIREAIKSAGWEASRNLSKHLEGVEGTQVTGAGNDKGIRAQGGKFDAPFAATIERLAQK